MSDGDFRFEADLVRQFTASLKRDWAESKVALEFDYSRGRVDVLMLHAGGYVMAFEAKLSKWRDALHQAYRNTSFCEESYVVLPASRADIALSHEGEFLRRGVGLCLVGEDDLAFPIQARRQEPLQTWLNELARHHIMSSNNGSDSCRADCPENMPGKVI